MLRLNCDLGESYGSWTMGVDEAVMPHIHQANIACGFHAGDPLTLRRTLQLAGQYGVEVGAHPAYPDLAGFGRRSMQLSADELAAALLYQVAALDGMAATEGLDLAYVKPHGALYNDMMRDPGVRATVMAALADYARPLPLMLQATAHRAQHLKEAETAGITLLFEAFADRCYLDDGSLKPRSRAGAVHDLDTMLIQVEKLLATGSVTTDSGAELFLHADSLCVHGDNAAGVAAITDIRRRVDAANRG